MRIKASGNIDAKQHQVSLGADYAPAHCDAGSKRRAVQESADGICTIPTAASGKAD